MTASTALEAVYLHWEAVNWGNLADVAGELDEEFVWSVIPEAELYVGASGYRNCVQWWRDAFPDFWLELKTLRRGDHWVLATHLLRGEHRGTFFSAHGFAAATGVEIVLPVCEIYQIERGRLARIETYYDMADLLRQMGRSAGFAPALPARAPVFAVG
jgi:predicted ester cyclase